MRVFKFGGASVKDATSVRNIPAILSKYRGDEIVIIISAMGKVTNAMEKLAHSAYHQEDTVVAQLEDIKEYHMNICGELFPDTKNEIFNKVEKLFEDLKTWLYIPEPARYYEFDLYYDQIVPFGELLSTSIVSAFMNEEGFNNIWMDARELVITNDSYRSAKVDWESSQESIIRLLRPQLKKGLTIVSQGFIGSNKKYTTTLGREGSDFSAAIFANILDAEEVVVWKDVPGYLNADPDYFGDTVKLDKISYAESIELAYYGAKIIHPKTIRPLRSKNIPLLVKSFLEPDSEGSVIHKDLSCDKLVPSYIIKEHQVLISISSRDFYFIAEDNLHEIFGIFARHRIGINLMQNSAISFSVCVDDSSRLQGLIKELQGNFRVKYNDELQLLSIRHYEHANLNELIRDKEILLEQRSRLTVQMVMKNEDQGSKIEDQ
jgi:aspartate kinase